MARRVVSPDEDPDIVTPRPPPARTDERRAQQLVGMAQGLIEERMRNGTASPTELVAVLRWGTALERANVERVKAHTQYLEAQRAKAEAETNTEQLFRDALDAMSRYQGVEGE